MVIVVPIYEEEMPGVYYNTAARYRRRRQLSRQVPQDHIPQVDPGFYEKFFFKPGDLGYPFSKRPTSSSAYTSAMTGTSRKAGVPWH